MSAVTQNLEPEYSGSIYGQQEKEISTEKFVEETSDLLNTILLGPQNDNIEEPIDIQVHLSSEDVSYADAVNTSVVPGVGEKEESVYQINLWTILRKSAINIVLPFINGMMLGFGEILAHEIGFRYNWVGAKVEPPRRIAQKNKRNQSAFL